MNNSTESDDQKPKDDLRFIVTIYSIWIGYFFVIALPNLVLVVSVMRYKALRRCKEHLIISGLCLADFIDRAGYSVAGAHRIWLISKGRWAMPSSIWSCVTLPQNILWWFGGPSSSIMLTIVSLDRLISVMFPIKYITFTARYAHYMLTPVYTFSFGMAALALGLGFLQRSAKAELHIGCFTGITLLAVNKYYATFYMYILPVSSMLSVVLYVALGVIYCKKKNAQVADQSSGNSGREQKRQRRLTQNLGLSCICTIAFVIIPEVITATGDLIKFPSILLQPLWLLPPVNSFFNVVIFYKRQPEIRQGLIGLLTNKTMPPVVQLWGKNRQATATQRNVKATNLQK